MMVSVCGLLFRVTPHMNPHPLLDIILSFDLFLLVHTRDLTDPYYANFAFATVF